MKKSLSSEAEEDIDLDLDNMGICLHCMHDLLMHTSFK